MTDELSRERLLEAIIASAIDYAIISMDREGCVTTWNEGARRILGWSEDDMLGRPADVFFTPEDRLAGVPDKEMESALRKGRGNDERWHLRKNGMRFWASGEIMTLYDEADNARGFVKILRDRTVHRQDEDRRRADAEFMERVLFASDDCIKVLDLDGNLTFMSEGGKRVMEVDDFNKIVGCPWPDFWRQEGNTNAKAAVASAREGKSARFLGEASTMAGSLRWWDVQVSPMFGSDGRPDRILSVSRDITATKVAEEQAAENERRLRLTLTAGHLGYWHLDLTNGEMECSDICKENYGCPADEVLTYERVLEAIHPDDRGRVEEAMRAAVEEGVEVDMQYRIARADATAWLMVRAQTIADAQGRIAAMSGISLDITDIKNTEERLSRSEERLNLALGASSMVGIWDWDLSTNLIYADPNFAEIYMIEPGRAAAGAPLDEYIRKFHPEDMPAFQEELDRLFAGQDVFNNEYRIVQPDGGARWVHARGRLILDPNGKALRFSGASVEITERKRAEETQRLLMHELAHRVKNMLAVVQAISIQTLRNADSLADAGNKLQSRIGALSGAHDVLMQSNWISAILGDVVSATVSNSGLDDGGRLRISGPSVKLAPQAALSFSLVLHELLTNAIKYGALSGETGHVDIEWAVRTIDGIANIDFQWVENGGPEVLVPDTKGFGSRLIASSLGAFGKAEMVYDPAGLKMTFVAPMTNIETQDGPGE